MENATSALNVFARFCSDRKSPPLSATGTLIAEYIRWLGKTRSRATLRNRLVNLKLFWEWLIREQLVIHNPLSEVKPPLVHPSPIRPYSDRELRRFAAVLRSPRDKALFWLYVGTGLRASEVLGLHPEDIDFGAGLIRVRAKGGKVLVSCPGLRVMSTVRVYMAADYVGRGWLFPGQNGQHLTRNTLYCWLRRLAGRAKVEHATVHRFRHTFGHRFLDAGGNVGDLQILFGHSKIATTLNYVAYGAQDRALESQRRLNLAEKLGA